MEGAGIRHHIFDGIEPDPPMEVVAKAVSMYQKHGCTMLIGLGGGSSIDGAKAVSLMASRQGDIREYGAGKVIDGQLIPIYAIPTTAGTGSEVTGVAVITDRENKIKMVLRGAQLIPKCVFLDPELLAFIPQKVAAETGGDALTHAIETYVSLNSTVITEGLALSSITIIGKYLRRMVGNPEDMEAAEQMLLASCMAGLCFRERGPRTCPCSCPSCGCSLSFESWFILFTLPSVCDGIQPAHLPGEICCYGGSTGGGYSGHVMPSRGKGIRQGGQRIVCRYRDTEKFFGDGGRISVESQDG